MSGMFDWIGRSARKPAPEAPSHSPPTRKRRVSGAAVPEDEEQAMASEPPPKRRRVKIDAAWSPLESSASVNENSPLTVAAARPPKTIRTIPSSVNSSPGRPHAEPLSTPSPSQVSTTQSKLGTKPTTLPKSAHQSRPTRQSDERNGRGQRDSPDEDDKDDEEESKGEGVRIRQASVELSSPLSDKGMQGAVPSRRLGPGSRRPARTRSRRGLPVVDDRGQADAALGSKPNSPAAESVADDRNSGGREQNGCDYNSSRQDDPEEDSDEDPDGPDGGLGERKVGPTKRVHDIPESIPTSPETKEHASADDSDKCLTIIKPKAKGAAAPVLLYQDVTKKGYAIKSLVDHRPSADVDHAFDLSVQWVGFAEPSWETERSIQAQVPDLLYKYWRSVPGGRPDTGAFRVFSVLKHWTATQPRLGGKGKTAPQKRHKYLVQWEGYSTDPGDTTVEPEEKLRDIAPDELELYWKHVRSRHSVDLRDEAA